MEETKMLSEIISSCHDIHKNLNYLLIRYNISECDDDIINISKSLEVILNHTIDISIKLDQTD